MTVIFLILLIFVLLFFLFRKNENFSGTKKKTVLSEMSVLDDPKSAPGVYPRPPMISPLPPITDEIKKNNNQINLLSDIYLTKCYIGTLIDPKYTFTSDSQCECIARLFSVCPRHNAAAFNTDECQRSINNLIDKGICLEIGDNGREFDNAVYPNR